MQYGQICLHERGLDCGSELRDPVYFEDRSQNVKNRKLMREVLDKLDECDGRLSELLIVSATDKSEANSPIKMTPQEDKEEAVYLSRIRKGTMRSNMVIDRINEMKMKLCSKVTLEKAVKTKDSSEISIKAANSAKKKRVKEAMDMGQGDG